MERVRVRLTFEGHILSKIQEEEGLKKSWILLNPKHYKTISNFSDHLFHSYHLHHSCPHGLLLYMDGFVLPPSESTRILKDNDVLCVRKKGGSSTELIKPGITVNVFGESEIVKQPVHAGIKLLANEEFEKETGGYESESEEVGEHQKSPDELEPDHTPDVEAVSKKRKASSKLQGSKKKKSKLVTAEETPAVLEDVENDQRVMKSWSSRRDNALLKNFSRKGKSSYVHVEVKKPKTSKIDETITKRSCRSQDNDEGVMDVSSTPAEAKKLPSRSARRKKAKRRWLREHSKMEKMELQQKQVLSNDNQQSPNKNDQNLSYEPREPYFKSHGKDNKTLSEEHEQPDANGDVDDDVVPVVIRPGHIRFEPLDAVPSVQENQKPVETFQWNGITNKKKGQKWGTEKAASSKRNNHEYAIQEYAIIPITKKGDSINDSKVLDFDKLRPYTSLPKEGDVIAYRLIELSEGWTPEPTSFRVGKISWVDSESSKILLSPVPEYPLNFEKKTDTDGDGSGQQSDTSLYGVDGSLQINFSLLVDVRAIKQADSKDADSVNGRVSEVHVGGHNTAPNSKDNDNHEKAQQPTQENGDVNAWEEITQALSAKKTELSNVKDTCTEDSVGKSRLSNKALRGSALGPTMAFLRANNVL